VHGLTSAFRSDGFDGASVSRMEEQTGLKRASLYHHFPGGKEDMAQAVLASAGERFAREVLAPLREEGDPAQRLGTSAAALDRFYRGGREPCLLEIFSLGGARAPLGGTVSRSFAEWIGALADLLTEAGADTAAAKTRAADAVAQVQGSLVLARATGEADPFARAIRMLTALHERT